MDEELKRKLLFTLLALVIYRIGAHIAAALQDARAHGISGKEVTPFLLARIRDLTAGDSQRANVALALNNAQLGARIARALSTSTERST